MCYSYVLLLDFRAPTVTVKFGGVLTLTCKLDGEDGRRSFKRAVVVHAGPSLICLPGRSILGRYLGGDNRLRSHSCRPTVVRTATRFLTLRGKSPTTVRHTAAGAIVDALKRRTLTRRRPLLLSSLNGDAVLLAPGLAHTIVSYRAAGTHCHLRGDLTHADEPIGASC